MQILMIAGIVGKDAELRNANGEDVLNFSLAVDNGKDKQGEKRPATWYDCAIWGKRATALESHITKGSRLALTGRPTTRAHDGKAYLGLTVNELTFMGGTQSEGGGQRRETTRSNEGFSGQAGRQSPRESYDFDDTIPF